MARRVQKVTFKERSPEQLPEILSETALLGRRLEASGFLSECERRLLLSRGNGYGTRALVAGLLLMGSSGLGQAASCAAARGCGPSLAACFALDEWISQSSLSRVLASLRPREVRVFADWLLGFESLGLTAIERSTRCMHRDTKGLSWLTGDADGRVNAIRQRGLPEDEESPEPSRRVDEIAAPGYPGRKRGETQVHSMVVQLAGSARFVGVRNGPGNGDHRNDVRWACQRFALAAKALGHPLERAVLRFDGKSVGPVTFEYAHEAGIKVLARWSDYGILYRPEMQECLAAEPWSPVPDSGGEPHRSARELCVQNVRFWSSASTDEPEQLVQLSIRLVVSRFRLGEKGKRGAGHEMNGWQYEIFATQCDAGDWPAGELVALYYGRSAQENRFEQMDKEMGKLRLVSTTPAGQEMAQAMELFLWNLRTTIGFEVAGAEAPQAPEQKLRDCEPLPTLNSSDEQGTAAQHEPLAPPIAPIEPAPPAQESVPLLPPAPPTPSKVSIDVAVPAPEATPVPPADRPLDGVISTVVGLLSEHLSAQHPNWRWANTEQCWLCPAGQPARLATIREAASTTELRFRTTKTACKHCERRASCTTSTAASYRKEIAVFVRHSDLAELGLSPEQLPKRRPPKPPNRRAQPQHRIYQQAPPGTPGHYLPAAPSIVPSYYRKLVAQLLASTTVTVRAAPPRPAPPRRHPGHAATAAERQHRRLTYEQRHARRRLPPECLPDITVAYPKRTSKALLMRICG